MGMTIVNLCCRRMSIIPKQELHGGAGFVDFVRSLLYGPVTVTKRLYLARVVQL